MERSPVLLTSATGFIGRYLYPALRAAGHEVRCVSRNPGRARSEHPDRDWARMDADDGDSVAAALDGCSAAYYLIHRLKGGADYPEQERRNAERFVRAAERAGVRRIVYLGGVAPRGEPSRHLASRLTTGEILRSGAVSTVELRAAMVIGAGSASWKVVRDLAKRLPFMVLPRWLRNYSWPVAIDDVVTALLAAVTMEQDGWFDVPGPERISHQELIDHAAMYLRHHRPRRIHVPVLSPRLSSYWIGLITSVDFAVARELVEGLRTDLDPSGRIIWDFMPPQRRLSVDEAIWNALADERSGRIPSSRAAERLSMRAHGAHAH